MNVWDKAYLASVGACTLCRFVIHAAALVVSAVVVLFTACGMYYRQRLLVRQFELNVAVGVVGDPADRDFRCRDGGASLVSYRLLEHD